ncbi:hypothetical protein TraAM80_07135 [Trypanosoma rangeli]|uniref:Uncharacterized protein n=1 Tax=Trypanosoma rangeli TaxID=5698 RepID=A0A3R7MET9_TRYRA|nr:uncharacterized protein TraAM80_07135 [Trypanosoma rangeli]RNF01234.1 hypothetical protein TraAM80_07135 [Trypanosoma rangeli]|eukprot:RNF01234.1 hypothetical protein TraAM80_07135 [Trypanosoma rangeli]
MRPSRRCTVQQGERTGDETMQAPHLRAHEASLTAQLKLQLYRIYANVSRQREWFRLHESNVKALTEEAEALRGCFFPRERSLLTAVNGGAIITTATISSPLCPSDTEGMGVEEMASKTLDGVRLCLNDPPSSVNCGFPSTTWRPCFPSSQQNHEMGALPLCPVGGGAHHPSDAMLFSLGIDPTSCGGAADVRHIVPEYLLQLSPDWIHDRLRKIGGGCVSAEEATSAVVALLLLLLQALRGVVDAAHWVLDSGKVSVGVSAPDGTVTFNTLRVVARHLFYLLHETLCCLSSWATDDPQSGLTAAAAAAHRMSTEERAEATKIFFYLWDDRDGGPLLLQLLCTDSNAIQIPPRHTELAGLTLTTTGLVPRSIVSQAFDFLAIRLLGMRAEEQ